MILPNSRYLLTDVIQVVDPTSGDATQPPFIDLRDRVSTFASDDRFVVVDSSMDWDSLSRNTLGDARFYWVIADLSGIIDPFTEMVVGERLRIPSAHRLLFNILASENTAT